MEHLNKLLLLTQDYQGLLFIFGIAITVLESFIPALPLIGIVITNSVLLGFLRDITASIIGSCLGTLILFLLFYFIPKKIFKIFILFINSNVKKVAINDNTIINTIANNVDFTIGTIK